MGKRYKKALEKTKPADEAIVKDHHQPVTELDEIKSLIQKTSFPCPQSLDLSSPQSLRVSIPQRFISCNMTIILDCRSWHQVYWRL